MQDGTVARNAVDIREHARRVVKLHTMLTLLQQDFNWNFKDSGAVGGQVLPDGVLDGFAAGDLPEHEGDWEGQEEQEGEGEDLAHSH